MTTEKTLVTNQKPSLASLNDSMLRMESMLDKMANAILSLNDRVSALETSSPKQKINVPKATARKTGTPSPMEKEYTVVHPVSSSVSFTKGEGQQSWGVLWAHHGNLAFTVGEGLKLPERQTNGLSLKPTQFAEEADALKKRQWKYGKAENWEQGLKSLFDELQLLASYACKGDKLSCRISFRKYGEDDFRVALYQSWNQNKGQKKGGNKIFLGINTEASRVLDEQ